jgi:hypothetical protein
MLGGGGDKCDLSQPVVCGVELKRAENGCSKLLMFSTLFVEM